MRIALGVAVRTLVETPPLELPLIRVFVPSLVATVGSRYGAGRFEFTLYLGYDADDPTYDDPPLLAGVTVALRRADLSGTHDPFADILDFIDAEKYLLLPNTSGAMNADEAVRLARLAATAGLPKWVKLEIHPAAAFLIS